MQVMTSNRGTARWQFPHQMAVAVVDNVKNVEIISGTPEITGIIEHPIKQAVGVDSEPARSGAPAESADEAWPDAHRLHCRQVIALQIFQQHLSDQIHARPLLLDEVA